LLMRLPVAFDVATAFGQQGFENATDGFLV
jgi:hypothetical protein